MMRNGMPVYKPNGRVQWVVWKVISGVALALNIVGDVACHRHRQDDNLRYHVWDEGW